MESQPVCKKCEREAEPKDLVCDLCTQIKSKSEMKSKSKCKACFNSEKRKVREEEREIIRMYRESQGLQNKPKNNFLETPRLRRE